MSETVRVGIIGCGGIANQKHMPALSRVKNAQMVAFFSIPRESAEKARAEYGTPGAKVYETIDELLEDKSIDAVCVCTPNRTHADISIRAMRAGKHVMCEKPMAFSSAEVDEMLRASRETGKKLTVGQQNRFRQDTWALKERCRKNELGKIYYARAQAVRRRCVPCWGAMLDRRMQGGGPLIDIGVHVLDLAMWMMDDYDVDFVSGNAFYELGKRKNEPNMFGSWDPEKFTVEDSAAAMIHMKSGAAILLEASWALNIPVEDEESKVLPGRESHLTLCGTEAGAELWYDGYGMNGARNGELYVDRYRFDFAPKYEGAIREAQTWIDAVANDEDMVVLPEQAGAVVKVIEAIYRSSERKAPVWI